MTQPPKSQTAQRRALVVSLHDVSPMTRAGCAAILAELRALGVPAVSLLVIPDHHHRAPMLADAEFGPWLRAQAAAGMRSSSTGTITNARVAMARACATKATTRFYTADEGEFYDLDRASATALVDQGARGISTNSASPTAGFIAPAWLLGREAEAALRELRCEYTTRLGSVLDLRTGRVVCLAIARLERAQRVAAADEPRLECAALSPAARPIRCCAFPSIPSICGTRRSGNKYVNSSRGRLPSAKR